MTGALKQGYSHSSDCEVQREGKEPFLERSAGEGGEKGHGLQSLALRT